MQKEAAAPEAQAIFTRAKSDAEIRATWPLMRQLRPTLDEDEYVAMVLRMQEAEGYRLLSLSRGQALCCVAGYRVSESLSWGKYLYIDDLVSDESQRSLGHGGALMQRLEAEAKSEGCGEIHLDSGTQRHKAHRFYLRERFDIVFFHFKKILGRD